MSIAELTLSDAEWQSILKSIKSKLGAIVGGGGAAQEKFAKIVSIPIYKDIIDHFERERGETGRWKQWSESYAEYLNKIGRGGNKILQFSGRLRQTFKPSSHKFDKGEIIFYNDAVTKSGFPYAYAHDTGGPKLPKRQFMWISGDAMAKVANIALDWLQEGDVK